MAVERKVQSCYDILRYRYIRIAYLFYQSCFYSATVKGYVKAAYPTKTSITSYVFLLSWKQNDSLTHSELPVYLSACRTMHFTLPKKVFLSCVNFFIWTVKLHSKQIKFYKQIFCSGPFICGVYLLNDQGTHSVLWLFNNCWRPLDHRKARLNTTKTHHKDGVDK